jgi:hypothetical protein
MRKLWTDHTIWTRDYIIAVVDDKPDAMAAANRLMKIRRTSATQSLRITVRPLDSRRARRRHRQAISRQVQSVVTPLSIS